MCFCPYLSTPAVGRDAQPEDIIMTLKEAIVLRHSVRKYLDKPIEAPAREAMNRLAAECNAESGLHIQIIYDDSTCFPALLAHFGMFRNAKNYIALVGKSSVPDLSGICGYYGQRLVLAAQQQGLNTCWIGGSYKKKKTAAEIAADEELICIIALGYGETQGSPRRSKPMEALCNVADADMPAWFRHGVMAAQLAPTAMNQQKFYITLEGDTVTVTETKKNAMSAIDRGIVRYQFEAGSGHRCF